MFRRKIAGLQQYLPFTVLKLKIKGAKCPQLKVATVLTVYGIETQISENFGNDTARRLQQYLPFTVLKLLTF